MYVYHNLSFNYHMLLSGLYVLVLLGFFSCANVCWSDCCNDKKWKPFSCYQVFKTIVSARYYNTTWCKKVRYNHIVNYYVFSFINFMYLFAIIRTCIYIMRVHAHAPSLCCDRQGHRSGTDPEINQGGWLASLGFKLDPS